MDARAPAAATSSQPQAGRKVVIDLEALEVTLPSRAGPVEILKGVDLSIDQGEAVSIVGPSGSGKTTLLMVISGLERATAGKVSVAGHDLVKLDEDRLAEFRRDQIGIVFQSFHLIPAMTALENVAVPLEFRGSGDAFGEARAQLERVGLGHRLDHYPGQLSGGEQQRVAIARALAAGVKIILADEPTGNLDQETGQTIMDLLFDLQRTSGTTLVLVTHDPGLAARCNRIVEIRDGLIHSDSGDGK
ncbi:MAG: ABC transporter ATP-binding protein [Anderseniella sp.]|jgi:putative ABC transport system ATP-binding protein|nr:ABC transporter ATP-binding protein [Anderseniella sp.]